VREESRESRDKARDDGGEGHHRQGEDPSKLDAVQVGDVVDITYTEALALAVEKAGGK
jgi:hypothetical protein